MATAKLFVAEGARVVIVGRDKGKLIEAVREVGKRGEVGDDSIAADCERIFRQTLSLHTCIDILVNFAGVIFRNRTVEQTSEGE